MALPKQVQKQLKEVEEYEKALEAQRNPEAVQDTDPETLETGAEVVTETEEVPAPEEVEPADTSPTDVEEETFKQKYTTLLGKYDAEVPRLHQQVRELNGELGQIRKDIAAKPVEPTKPKEKVSFVTDEDRAEYGEELLDVQRRVAKEVSQDYEDRIERQDAVIAELQEKLAATGNQVAGVDFERRLQQAIPDWSQIDNDERWVAWLNEHDPMLRGQRRVLAQAAFDNGDVEAVSDYVKLWKSSLGEPDVAKQIRKTELEKQVAPNRSANSTRTQSASQNAKLYSQREIDNAWTKVRTLNSRGKYADAEKLEAELTVAYMEGRVRQ